MEVLYVFSAIVLIAIPFLVGVWILLPIDRAAKSKRASIRFTILDFFGLAFQFQVVTAVAYVPFSAIEGFKDAVVDGGVWIILASGWLAVALVWGIAVKVFSQAGIDRAGQRAVLIFFVLPVAYAGSFAISILLGTIFSAWERGDRSALPWMIIAEGLLIICAISSGVYTRRVVATNPSENTN